MGRFFLGPKYALGNRLPPVNNEVYFQWVSKVVTILYIIFVVPIFTLGVSRYSLVTFPTVCESHVESNPEKQNAELKF